ncbi:MAG TPA: ABC transporter permease [Candidatus Acidoferrales bacterium]|nr:ABC transporter permease [Candidatus Acidoferrales bacterium]
MRRLRAFFLRFAATLHLGRRQGDFAEEMEAHIQLHVDDNLRAGMSPAEARRRALLRLGGATQTREQCRENARLPWLDNLARDLQYATRTLRKNPGFTSVAILTLALGIGANSAIFSVVKAVLLKPLPYREANSLVMVWEQKPQSGWYNNIVSIANFVDWKSKNHVFEDMAAVNPTTFNLTGAGEPAEIEGVRATANLFTLLGVKPWLGRGFLPEDDDPGNAPVAVLSYPMWQRFWAGDRAAIGKQVVLNGVSHTVVGIMPAGYADVSAAYFQEDPQLWTSGLPLRPGARTDHTYVAMARLKRGVAVEQAQSEMDAIARGIEQQYPEAKGWGVGLVRIHDQAVGGVRPALLVVLGAVFLVLLIACANLASLLLARGAGRGREIGIRTALGAGRGRLMQQLLAENLQLAALGGTLGLALAGAGVRALRALAPAGTWGIDAAGVDLQILGYTMLLTAVTGILFGVAPALTASRPDVNELLKTGVRGPLAGGKEGARGWRLRGLLVAAEFALALVLVAGAALMIRTMVQFSRVELGFDPRNVLTMRMPLRGVRYRAQQSQSQFFQQLLARVERLPGVQSVSISRGLPINGWAGFDFWTEDHPDPAPGEVPGANYLVVSPQYFAAMGIPLRQGRVFADSDTPSALPAAIVNAQLASDMWPGQNPIGKRLRLGATADNWPWLTVVGVAGNVLTRGPKLAPRPELYVPYTQFHWVLNPRHLVVRSTAPGSLAAAIRREAIALDPDVPVANVKPMEEIIAEPLQQRRFLMTLLAAFGALAMGLAAVGIYGVVSYSVAQRTHEIGIRMALGAAQADVLRLMIRRGMALAMAGVAAGLAGALALTRFLGSLLFHVKATDPATFLAVALILTAVALLATYIAARRAARIDPMAALRRG